MTFSFRSTRKEDTLYARSKSIQLTVSLYNGTIVTVHSLYMYFFCFDRIHRGPYERDLKTM